MPPAMVFFNIIHDATHVDHSAHIHARTQDAIEARRYPQNLIDVPGTPVIKHTRGCIRGIHTGSMLGIHTGCIRGIQTIEMD